MGIKGLIPALKDVIESGVHVRKFQGHKVAVDTYSWLHKGTFGCALELCIGAPTDTYITYCTDRVKMLLHNNVTPVMVFDGANLPSKDGTENLRKNRREVEMAKGKHLLKAGNRAGATACFQRAVDVTPEMAHKLIKALKKMNVEIIVAPYEADAQVKGTVSPPTFKLARLCIALFCAIAFSRADVGAHYFLMPCLDLAICL